MSTDADPDYAAVMEAAKRLLSCGTDTALAKVLGLSTGGLANYKKRNSVPWDRLIREFRLRGMSVDRLMKDEFPTDVKAAAPVIAEPKRPRFRRYSEDDDVPQCGVPPPDFVYPVREAPAVGGGERAPPVAGDDARLSALTGWLTTWWASASEEERAWMVVELRMLRGRMPGAGGSI